VGSDDRVAAAAAAEAMATPARRARILTALDGVLALMSVLLVTQMWLLTATLESVLAGHDDARGAGRALVRGPVRRLRRSARLHPPPRAADTMTAGHSP
jgi:hypothetical protein